MSRGPQKQFDPDEVLDRAVVLFQERGYAAAGLAELCEVMGIGKKSLYDTFGDKRQLFIRALQRYAEQSTGAMRERLARSRSPLQGLRRLLRDKATDFCCADANGCLLGVGIAQAPSDDPELSAILATHLRSVRKEIRHALECAREAGELGAGTSIDDIAQAIVTALQGLAVVGRAGGFKSARRSTLAMIDALLDAQAQASPA